jgi:rhamnose transport system substrate-binding protein
VQNLGTLAFQTSQLYAQCKIQPTTGSKYDAPGLGTFTVGDKGVVLLGDPTIVTTDNMKTFPF